MDQNRTNSETDPNKVDPLRETELCWKELLDTAFTGWAPADQTLEHIIDRMERGS